jgi:hypothetical protein
MPSRPLRFLMIAPFFFVTGSIIAYFTSLCVIYLQGYQLNMVEIGLMGTINDTFSPANISRLFLLPNPLECNRYKAGYFTHALGNTW